MAAYKPSQKYSSPYSECLFSESKVTGLSRDAYNPGNVPNVYVENTKGTNSIQVNTDNDDRSRALNKEWHDYGGFAGRVHKTLDGFKQNAGPAGNHPKTSGKGSWPSVGIDTPTQDQGSPKGGFSWK